jgi:hypothetical protein
VDNVVLFENLPWVRVELKTSDNLEHVEYILPENLSGKSFKDKETGNEMERVEGGPLVDWLEK